MTELRARFTHPPRELHPRPLWFWNAPLDRDETIAIMERCAAIGYAGFGILGTPQMTPAFMTPEYLAHYGHALDTARRLGLKMCLYDEFWFPSGQAGGLLAERYPEALGKRLDIHVTEVQGPEGFLCGVPEGTLMAAVAMNTATSERIDLAEHVRDGMLSWHVPPGAPGGTPSGNWRIMLFVCVTDGARGLVDYLDPDATARFIELTYETYYAHFAEHFGTTIDSAFYDEPTMHWIQGGRAWTPAFNRKFIARHGFDPAILYPALWYDIGPETAAARNALLGFRADLYADGFMRPLNEWCRSHGIRLTGHQDQEEVVNPVGLSGDLIKCFRDQDIPGVDQIFSYGRASGVYKIVSSAAYNYDRPLVMTECYGAMDDLPVANLYREALDQFAKGINLMVPHAVWTDPAHIVFQPELSHRTEPYASALPAYNTFAARLQALLQGGRHVADIAVLYPIATLQADYYFGTGMAYQGGVIPVGTDYMAVGEMLSLDVRRDFTYLHPDVLLERCEVTGDTLILRNETNWEQYRVVILPGCRVISADVLQRIREFHAGGGRVIATTCLPEAAAESGRDAEVRAAVSAIFDGGPRAVFVPAPSAPEPPAPELSASALQAALDRAAFPYDVRFEEPVSVAGGNLSYIHKVLDGHDIYFFANSSDTPVETWVSLRGRHTLEHWNPHDGTTGTVEQAQEAGDITRVRLALPPVTGLFLVAE